MSIRKVSKKQQGRLREYKKVRSEYLSNHEHCEVCTWRAADQIHHKKGRIGSDLTDAKYFLAVCGTCHRHIEDNPKWAYAKGYSVKRLNI